MLVEEMMGDLTYAKDLNIQVPEPINLYKGTAMKQENAFIVRRGYGPYTWTPNPTAMARCLGNLGESIIFSKGKHKSQAYYRSLSSSLIRSIGPSKRRTMVCIQDLPTGESGKVSHLIFSAAEFTFD